MAVTTWDVPVEFEYPTSRERRVLRTQPISGFVARRSKWPQSAALRSWRLVWRNATDAAVARLRQMWTLSRGGSETFTYTPIDDGAATTIRFVGDGLRIVRKGCVFHEVSVEIEEVRL